MQNFKKNLGFNLTLVALGALFIFGCLLAFLAYQGSKTSAELLTREFRDKDALLGGHEIVPGAAKVSLDEKNVESAAADVKELEGHLSTLRFEIAGSSDLAINGKASANSAELSALLRESVDGWRKLVADQGIKLAPNEPTAFGFYRYIHNQGTAPKRDFQKVDQQRQVIDFLVKQLAESRQPGSPLLIESIDREPLETYVVVPEGKPNAGSLVPDVEGGAKNEADEFQPVRTFDRTGLVDALSFRVRFVGYTPTMRTFVNKVRNSGRPVAITLVEVGLASKEMEKLLAAPVALAVASADINPAAPAFTGGFFGNEDPVPVVGGAKSAGPSADQRILVVPKKLSTFIVQIDYLSIPEVKPAATAEGDPK